MKKTQSRCLLLPAQRDIGFWRWGRASGILWVSRGFLLCVMYTSDDNRRDNVSVKKKIQDVQNRKLFNFRFYSMRLIICCVLCTSDDNRHAQAICFLTNSSVLSTYIIYTALDFKLECLILSQMVSAVACHSFGPGSNPWGCIFKFSAVDIYYIHCARFQITTPPPQPSGIRCRMPHIRPGFRSLGMHFQVQCCRHTLYTLCAIPNYNGSPLAKWYPLSDATPWARVQIPGDAF